jgi:hypothetical protein
VRTRPRIVLLSVVSVLTLYIVGYFFVVHPRLQNPFVSWPIRRPLPTVAYYRVESLRLIYQPAVWLDQRYFPTRWICPPTPRTQYDKGIDLNRIHEMSKPPNLESSRSLRDESAGVE